MLQQHGLFGNVDKDDFEEDYQKLSDDTFTIDPSQIHKGAPNKIFRKNHDIRFLEDAASEPDADIDALFADSDETISLGTSAILSTLKKFQKKSNPPIFDNFFINFDTIVRNNVSLDRSDDEILSRTMGDISAIFSVCTEYLQSTIEFLSYPSVVVYVPNYSRIPELHLRGASQTRNRINTLRKTLINKDNLSVTKQIRNTINDVDCYELYAGNSGLLPYRSLKRFMQNQFNLHGNTSYVVEKRFALVSHYALDYHLLNHYKWSYLIESFTGTVRNAQTLGYKVFGNNFIPFNSVTHLLFGDSTHMRPMATRRNRKLLMDLAARQNWGIRSPREIARYVENSGQVPPGVLTKLIL